MKKKRLSIKKRLQVEKLIPELELKQKSSKQKTEATLYEGFGSIKNFFKSILDDLSAGESYHVLGAAYGEKKGGVKAFFQNFHTERAKKKIKVKMLANYDVKNALVKATGLVSEIRFLPKYLVTDMSVVFYKNKTFIFFLTEEPKGFLMEDENAVKSFKTYFDVMWKLASK